MDSDSINLMLGWFPYTEDEKSRLRSLLSARDQSVMSALSNFLQNKDVSALNKEFRNVLNSNSQPNIQITKKSFEPEYRPVSVPSNEYKPAQEIEYKPLKETNVSPGIRSPQINRKSSRSRNESPKKSVMVADSSISSFKKFMKKGGSKKNVSAFDFEFLKEYETTKSIRIDSKKKLAALAETLVFDDFLDFRNLLGLDKIELTNFVEKAQRRILEIHPLQPHQSIATYNPGFTLEEFIELLCGEAELKKEKLGYICLMFNFLDYNCNGLLEMDEIFQGLIILSPGDQKDKITAAFRAFDRDGSLTLDEHELAHYLEVVIRIHSIKDAANSDDKSEASLFKIQNAIDLASKSLAKRVFEGIDTENSGNISVEEFLLWFERMQKNKNDLLNLKNDIEFQKSLTIAKNIKKKRLEFIQYKEQSVQILNNEKVKEDFDQNKDFLKGICDFLHLNELSVSSAIKVYNQMKENSSLTVDKFYTFIESLIKLEGVSADKNVLKKELVKFFQILDTNKNGVLEWDELMGILIFLLKGSQNEKTLAVFKIFDQDNNNRLQFKELFFFLRGVFNVLLYGKSSDLLKKENYETVAFSTTKKCFDDNKLDLKIGAIDFSSFKKWYQENL